MKNLFSKSLLYLGVLGLLVLAACSDDDEADVNPVIGTWSLVSAELTSITVDGASISDFFTALIGATGLEGDDLTAAVEQSVALFESGALAAFNGLSITFNEAGTYSVVLAGETSTGSWSANADNSVYTLSPDPDDEDPNPADIIFTVNSLTDTAADFDFSQTQSQDLGTGTESTIVISLNMSLSKDS